MKYVCAVVSDGRIFFMRKNLDYVLAFCRQLVFNGSSYVFAFSLFRRRPHFELIYHFYEEVSDA